MSKTHISDFKRFSKEDVYEYFRALEQKRILDFDDDVYTDIGTIHSLGILDKNTILQLINDKIAFIELGEFIFNKGDLFRKYHKDYFTVLYEIFEDNIYYYFNGNGGNNKYNFILDYIAPLLGKYLSNIKEIRNCMFYIREEESKSNISGGKNIQFEIIQNIEKYSTIIKFDEPYVALRNQIIG